MRSTQQILRSVMDMQGDAQQALPVIPNNGNPMGANNMPHRRVPIAGGRMYDRSQPTNTGPLPPHMNPSPIPIPQRGGQPVSPEQVRGGQPRVPGNAGPLPPAAEGVQNKYPWLAPSAAMRNVRGFLDNKPLAGGRQFGNPEMVDPSMMPVMPQRPMGTQVDPANNPILLAPEYM